MVVSDAVASGVRSYERLLLTTVDFTFGGINGVSVDWSRTTISVFINLFPTDIFPPEHTSLGVTLTIETYACETFEQVNTILPSASYEVSFSFCWSTSVNDNVKVYKIII